MRTTSPRWTLSRARAHFSELLAAVAEDPQPVYRRNRLVAVVVDAETYERFLRWSEQQAGESIADAFAGLRRVADEEDPLDVPNRVDRANPLAEALDAAAG